MMRQFLFDAFSVLQWEALSRSSHEGVAAVAAKSLKEAKYHLRHSSEWVVRLGDGTEESHARAQRALDAAWRFTGELFARDLIDDAVVAMGVELDQAEIKSRWDAIVDDVLARATLVRPADVTNQVPDVSKFTRETGWKPTRSVDDSVDFLLAYWRSEAESVARRKPTRGPS
jgi:ring-1,2-phenylacetyl-CoA epoxidase subunit PaaC